MDANVATAHERRQALPNRALELSMCKLQEKKKDNQPVQLGVISTAMAKRSGVRERRALRAGAPTVDTGAEAATAGERRRECPSVASNSNQIERDEASSTLTG